MDPETFDPVSMDTGSKDEMNRASLDHQEFFSEGERILGMMLRAQGEGPHPVALILHGFPGHDWNLDIAHTLRRGGMNVILFHYRGSWGSGGSISFGNMLVDVANIIDQMIERGLELDIDTSDITLIGHSMGGWASLMTACKDERVKRVVSICGFNLGSMADFIENDENGPILATAILKDLTVPLNTIPMDDLISEIIDNGREWDIMQHVPELGRIPVLLIGGSNDTLSMLPIHFDPIVSEFQKTGSPHFRHVVLDSDHSLSDARIELQRYIWEFLRGME